MGGLALAAAATVIPSSASACGGFFCAQEPIDQTAEQIAFAVNPENNTVDAHIRIFYQGTAEDFAWIVPVKNVPELFISTEELFNVIGWQTDPQFSLRYEEEGTCSYDGYYGYGYGGYAESVMDGSYSYDDGGYDVTIVAEQEVGPYETVTLQAESTEELLGWLQANDYDLPNDLDPVLTPYVSGGAYFVALRLGNDKDVGDIAPLGMTYEGNRAAIPIQLTSIAAMPDMRLEVTVFGKARFVPESYLHVEINEAAINWLEWGSNYEEVISLAADEAGGHAFATDFAGSTDDFEGWLYVDGRFDLDVLRTMDEPAQFVDELLAQSFPRNLQMQQLLRTYIPMPQEALDAGVEEDEFYNCLDCYPEYLELVDFDPEAFASALDEMVVQPLIRAEALYTDHPYMSRMTSSLDAEEMTVDPVFVHNAVMGDVSNYHEAALVTQCGDGGDWYTSPRFIELDDGTQIAVPPQEWFDNTEGAMSDFMSDLSGTNAAVIETTSEDSDPVMYQDNSETIAAQVAAHNERFAADGQDLGGENAAGCGCSSGVTGAPLAPALGLVGLLALARRREA
jgi:MYXO-CTERM domain-containing protein